MMYEITLNILLNISASNRLFLTVNQSMFTEVEVANQWHCRAHNNLCPTLHKKHVLFVCDQAYEQLTQE